MRFMAVVIQKGDRLVKLIIDYADISVVDPVGYEWCDHYAKINIDFGGREQYDKLFSIGPSFGIRIFSPAETIRLAVGNYFKGLGRIAKIRHFMAAYKAQLKRYPISEYQNPAPSDQRAVFFASSLWKQEPETNQFRANFIRACRKAKGIDFVGGFSPRIQKDVPGFDELTMNKRIGFDQYIDLTKHSLTVFSTPAVKHCHGWKLGEFLAMGKAIISTALTRELPQPLVDGKHLLITDGSEENIAAKLEILQTSDELRKELETNALRYFNENLLPEKVVAAIVKRALADPVLTPVL